jgi:hypothetical protein
VILSDLATLRMKVALGAGGLNSRVRIMKNLEMLRLGRYCASVLTLGIVMQSLMAAPARNGMVYWFPIYQTVQPIVSATSYNSFTNGLTAWDSVESTNLNVAGGAGPWTYDAWSITLANAPGAGKSWTFTLRVNETDTALTVTISDAATTRSDLIHSVTIKPGDRFGIKCVPSGAPMATGDIQRMIRITASAPNQQLISTPSAVSHALTAGNTYYMAPDQRGNQTNESAASFPWPASGTISALYVDLEAAPGGTASVVVTLRKNGVDTAVACTVTGAFKANSDLAHSVSIAAGDSIAWRVVVSAGSAMQRPRIGALFAPTTNGQVGYIFEGAVVSSATRYMAGQVGGGPTETRTLRMPACTISSLYSQAGGGSAGQTDTLTLRKNQADTTLTCTLTCPVTRTSTTANDTTHSVEFALGDTSGVRLDASAGNITFIHGAFVMFFVQASA